MQYIAQNEAVFDLIVNQYFPNVLPGQADDIDIMRLFRFIEAKSTITIEQWRQMWADNGFEKPESTDPAAYRGLVDLVLEHDRIIDLTKIPEVQ